MRRYGVSFTCLGLVRVRKILHLLLFVVLSTTGLAVTSTAAQAADTGNAAQQNGKIVSDEPGKNAPNILDGTVNSIAKVGNTIVVGGSFTQARNYNTQATLTRRNLLAYDVNTGKISTVFAPDPDGTVFKVLPAADGTSVYVAGGFDQRGRNRDAGPRVQGGRAHRRTRPRLQGADHQREHPRPRGRRQPALDCRQVHAHQRHSADGARHALCHYRQARPLHGRRLRRGAPRSAAPRTSPTCQVLRQQAEHPPDGGRELHHRRRPEPPPDRPARHHRRRTGRVDLVHEHVQPGVLAELRDLHDRRRVLPERPVLRRLDNRCLRGSRRQHGRDDRLRRGRPLREQFRSATGGRDLDGLPRRRHHVDRRGDQQRRVRRRPPALAEQPGAR